MMEFADFINGAVGKFLALGGVAALVSAIVAFGKYFGVIPDGKAADVSKALNLIGLAAFIVSGFFNFDFAALDPAFASFASILMTLLALLGQLGIKAPWLSSLFYRLFRRYNVKILGYAHPQPLPPNPFAEGGKG